MTPTSSRRRRYASRGLSSRAATWLVVACALAAAFPSVLPAVQAQQNEPNLSINLSPPTLSLPLNVEIGFRDRQPESVSLFARTTGSGEGYTVVAATPDGADPSTFSLSLPAEQVALAGLDLYVEYVQDGEIRTFPEVENPALEPLQFPVFARRVEAPVTLLPRQYKMVTVPVGFLSSQEVVSAINLLASEAGLGIAFPRSLPAVGAVLGDDDAFGPYDPERWRVLRWDPVGGDPSAGTYLDGPLAVGPFAPGKGLWLVAANGGGFDVESVYTTGFDLSSAEALAGLERASLPVEVLLEPGWNQVGNPYLFPVAWEQVEGAALVNAPVAFDGADYEPEQEVLEPWEGYFVFNPTPGVVPLLFSIPEDAPDPQPALAARLLEKTGADAFLLQVVADEVTEGADRPLHSRNTFMGIGTRAKRIATPASPAPGLHVRVRDQEGQALAAAIAESEDGAAWTLELRADDAWTRRRSFAVSLAEHGHRPVGWDYRLTDADTGEPISLSGGAVRVSLGPGEVRRFHVTLGPGAALAAEALAETGPLFGSVGPNPVSVGRGVRVAYRTPGGASELVVLDLLGRPVHHLARETQAGWHEAVWDGTAQGVAVAPGLYVLHLRTADGQAAHPLTVVR